MMRNSVVGIAKLVTIEGIGYDTFSSTEYSFY